MPSWGQVIFHGDKVLRRQKRIGNRALLFIARDLRKKMRDRLHRQSQKNPHSKPGESPLVDTGKSPLKTLIHYSIDKSTGRVFVGPMRFRDSKTKTSSTVPHILEKGGTAIAHVKEFRPEVLNRVSRRQPGKMYFSTPAKRRRAQQAERYKEWRRNSFHVVNRPVVIKPRPFVEITKIEYMQSGGPAKALKRAANYK